MYPMPLKLGMRFTELQYQFFIKMILISVLYLLFIVRIHYNAAAISSNNNAAYLNCGSTPVNPSPILCFVCLIFKCRNGICSGAVSCGVD